MEEKKIHGGEKTVFVLGRDELGGGGALVSMGTSTMIKGRD